MRKSKFKYPSVGSTWVARKDVTVEGLRDSYTHKLKKGTRVKVIGAKKGPLVVALEGEDQGSRFEVAKKDWASFDLLPSILLV